MKKTLQALSIALLAVAGSYAMADESSSYGDASSSSSVTRAQVNAELAQARAHGDLTRSNEVTYVPSDASNAVQTSAAAPTRSTLNAELAAARANGALQTDEAENEPASSVRSRAEVRAETIAYLRSHPFDSLEAMGYTGG